MFKFIKNLAISNRWSIPFRAFIVSLFLSRTRPPLPSLMFLTPPIDATTSSLFLPRALSFSVSYARTPNSHPTHDSSLLPTRSLQRQLHLLLFLLILLFLPWLTPRTPSSTSFSLRLSHSRARTFARTLTRFHSLTPTRFIRRETFYVVYIKGNVSTAFPLKQILSN